VDQPGDVMTAGEDPGQVAVGLDGFPDQGQEVLVEHAFPELAVEVLVFVQRQQQASVRGL